MTNSIFAGTHHFLPATSSFFPAFIILYRQPLIFFPVIINIIYRNPSALAAAFL